MTDVTNNPLLSYWIQTLEQAERSDNVYQTKVEKIIDRYRDERSNAERSSRLNILWSNVETLKPALYSSQPKPQIERRFKDYNPLIRASSQVLERALQVNLDLCDFDLVMRACVQDLLLAGRAVARVRYVPELLEVPQEPEQQNDFSEEIQFMAEKVVCDYVHWQDFLHAPARRWADVSWVAFRNYLSRDELRSRFGAEKAAAAHLSWQPGNAAEDWAEMTGKVVVWEVWDKTTKQVLWVAKGGDIKESILLEVQEDPLHLSGFFPCPQPLFATLTNDQLTPVPDYLLYQDQAIELDILTSRITSLAKIIRLRGVYDASAEPLQRLLSDYGAESQLIPVDQWSALAQKGGLDGIVSWLPVERMVQVLSQLYMARERVKNDLYEITGIADIIRGASAPSETATAQQIKGRFATLRLSERQKDVARFSRDLIRLQAEMIAEHFSASTLHHMTGLDVTPQMVDLLRGDQMRKWKIDIETDSTIATDEMAEKQTRIEFLTAVTNFMKEVAPLVQAGAVPLPVAKAMLLFGARGFRVGRELESVLESIGQDQLVSLQDVLAQSASPQNPSQIPNA